MEKNNDFENELKLLPSFQKKIPKICILSIYTIVSGAMLVFLKLLY